MKHPKQDIEDAKKLEEEKRISEMVPGKSPAGGATMKKGGNNGETLVKVSGKITYNIVFSGAWRRPGDNVKPT